MTSRISQRLAVQQDLYELFHDYWNVFTALNSFVAVLKHSPRLEGLEREAVDEIDRMMGRLQDAMEAVRARVLAMGR